MTSVPIETHFNGSSGHADPAEIVKERKLSSAHSGSAPSLNTSGETTVLRSDISEFREELRENI